MRHSLLKPLAFSAEFVAYQYYLRFLTTYEPNSFIQPFLYHLTSFRVFPPSHICSTAVSALSVAYSSARPETSFVKLAPWYLSLQEPTTYIAWRPPMSHGASYAVIGYGRGSPHVVKQLQWCGSPYGLNVSHDAGSWTGSPMLPYSLQSLDSAPRFVVRYLGFCTRRPSR